MKFTEDTRVKIPVLLHLIRLGYSYLSLKTQTWDKETNIPVQPSANTGSRQQRPKRLPPAHR